MKSPTENDEALPSLNSGTDKTALTRARRGEVVVDDGALSISSDITANFPITAGELDLIERYFGDVLDAVLGGSKNAATTLSCHKRER